MPNMSSSVLRKQLAHARCNQAQLFRHTHAVLAWLLSENIYICKMFFSAMKLKSFFKSVRI